jgi:hypothetical protein
MVGVSRATSRTLVATGVSIAVLAVLAWVLFSGLVRSAGSGVDAANTLNGHSAGATPSAATPASTSTPTPKPTTAGPKAPTTTAPPPRTGTGKPGPSNTGPLAGTTFRVINGDTTFSTPGTYSNLDIHGYASVTAKGVTIKNSIFRGGAAKCNASTLYIAPTASATIEDSEVNPDHPNACLDGIWASNTTLLRMNIHGATDGMKAFDNVTVQDSWIHDLSEFASDPNQNGGPTHNDAVQTYEGNQHITLRHNVFVMNTDDNAAYQVSQGGGKIATDLHIESNWLDGGGCTLNFSSSGGPPMTGIYVVNNRFGRHSSYQCPILVSTQTTLSQNTGNVWDDTGAPIPPPQRHD